MTSGDCLKTCTDYIDDSAWSLVVGKENQLISGCWSGCIKFWNLETGRCFENFFEHKDRVLAVAISAESHLISGSGVTLESFKL